MRNCPLCGKEKEHGERSYCQRCSYALAQVAADECGNMSEKAEPFFGEPEKDCPLCGGTMSAKRAFCRRCAYYFDEGIA